MKQRDRRKKTAIKRHEQRRRKDEENLKKRPRLPAKPIILTKSDIENSIATFEAYAQADAEYMGEEKVVQRDLLRRIILSGILIAMISIYILTVGPALLAKAGVYLVFMYIMMLGLRYHSSHEIFKSWKDSYERHIRYTKDWRIRLRDHDAGFQITVTPYMMR